MLLSVLENIKNGKQEIKCKELYNEKHPRKAGGV